MSRYDLIKLRLERDQLCYLVLGHTFIKLHKLSLLFFQFLLTVNGMIMVTGLNAPRVVEVEPKSEPEKSKLKLEMEEEDVMEPTRIFNFAMNSLVQVK